MNKSLLNTALKSLIPNTETYEERCYVFKQTKNMEPKRKNHWKIACFESSAYSFSYCPSFVYNTKFEYINIPPLVLCHLEVINVRDFACQESYRHIYTLMAPNQNKDQPSEPDIYSIYLWNRIICFKGCAGGRDLQSVLREGAGKMKTW